MNTIRTVADLVKALSAYPENAELRFSTGARIIGRGLYSDNDLYLTRNKEDKQIVNISVHKEK